MLKTNAFLRSRKIPLLAMALALGLAALPQAPRAQEAASPLAGMEKEAVEQLVREYLLAHPEVVVEALQRYEQQQQALEAERLKEALDAAGPALVADPADPVLGNPDGDVTLVEFFDYRCPYCKRMTDTLAALIKEDSNLRVVMKEFPILSRESVQAARAALAAERQGKYEAFHFALMENGGSFTDDEILAVAESVGLDAEALQKDMQDPSITAALQRTNALAESIGITGTPAFVIGDTMIPGATSLEALRAQIAEIRAKAS
ncbi:DsbA family protein [Pelagibius sp. 7325]|uniref:DsbA family protein n=1 Tax=Pelagibius sp. 7325 TaxID=3131994 RepID=UPI0030EBE023